MQSSRSPVLLFLVLLLLLPALSACTPLLFAAGYAQTQPAEEPAEPAAGEESEAAAPFEDAGAPPSFGYRDLIPADAFTEQGVFTVHAANGRWYFELPAALLGRDLLWHAEIDAAPFLDSLQPDLWGLEPFLGDHVVYWEQRGDLVVLRDRTGPLTLRAPEPPADPDAPAVTVQPLSLPAVLAVFPVVVRNDSGDPVIDVTDYFASDLAEASAMTPLSFAGLSPEPADPGRSLVAAMRAFPENVIVRSLLTFPLQMANSSVATVQVAHSFTLLPETPMRPRFADPRVGYFTTAYTLFDDNDRPGLQPQELIVRYRLEKADPDAATSDPVQPIVFYLAPEIPEKWRPYIRQGVEDWLPAFAEAGFSNAIRAVDAPTAAEDPTWDVADSRHSVIRWMVQPIENAFGPNIYDPRTGEVLAGRVFLNDDILQLLERTYVAQAGAVDERARRLPLPDELLGALLRYVTAHEVGHVLGLRHNFKAAQAYTTAQLRDPAFTAANSHVASIMSYGRFNYVAQPEDGVTALIPQIGSYDRFALHWGYAPIDAATLAAERATLDTWLAAQQENPWLLFGGEDWPAETDPTTVTENIGADRIATAQLGITNLLRILDSLVDATVADGEMPVLLGELYGTVLDNRTTWLAAAIMEIGGVEETRTLQAGHIPFVRVPVERQRAALTFVVQNLRSGAAFVRPEIAARLGPTDQAAAVGDSNKRLLDELLDGERYLMLHDAALVEPANALALEDYLASLQAGLFAELGTPNGAADPLLQTLQRYYVRRLQGQLQLLDTPYDPEQAMTWMRAFGGWDGDYLARSLPDTSLRAAGHAALRQLRAEIDRALPEITDAATRMHYEDMRAMIEE